MNSQLVKGAAVVNKQFQDHGKAFNQGYMQGRDPNAMANAQYEAKMERRNNEAKVDSYMNSLPADFDVSQIPDKYRDKISSFLTAGKQAYADEAMNINEYESGSDEYIAAVSKMNSVKNSFKNLKNQFDMFGANKKEVSESMLEGLYSKGNSTSEMSLLTSVYTDELDIEIGEDGNIGFMTEEGVTNFGDLPDYFNKDYASGDAIMKMSNQIYKAGIPLNSATKMMYENNLYNMIEKGGVATLKSLARDDFFNRGGIPSITDEELNDPMQRDAVEKKIVDHFMGVMNTQAENGAAAKQNSTGSSNGRKNTDSYNKNKAYYTDVTNHITAVKNGKADIKMLPMPNGYDMRVLEDGTIEIATSGSKRGPYDLDNVNHVKNLLTFLGIRSDVSSDYSMDISDVDNTYSE